MKNNVKNNHGGIIFLTKSNTPLWVFSTFFDLYKSYQIAQSIIYIYLLNFHIFLLVFTYLIYILIYLLSLHFTFFAYLGVDFNNAFRLIWARNYIMHFIIYLYIMQLFLTILSIWNIFQSNPIQSKSNGNKNPHIIQRWIHYLGHLRILYI